MKNYYEDDLEELSKNLFFYILTKTNDILYDTNKDYKKICRFYIKFAEIRNLYRNRQNVFE